MMGKLHSKTGVLNGVSEILSNNVKGNVCHFRFFSLIIRFSLASDRRVSLQLQRVPAKLSHTRTQNFS